MIFVTGAAGHSGKFFLEELKESNPDISMRLLVRSAEKLGHLREAFPNAEIIHGSIEDSALLEESMNGVSSVLHIAGIQKSLPVVQVAFKNRVPRIILVHTTGIYSKFKSAADDYLAIEQQIADISKNTDYQVELVILRPTMIFGDLCDLNISKFIRYIDKLPIMPVVDRGDCLVQPVNARDLGKAYVHVLNAKQLSKRDYILSGERALSLKEVFQLISKQLGKRRRFISVPSFIAVTGASIVRMLTFGRIDYVERVQRMTESRAFPHDKASEDFAYKPDPFVDGIAREVTQYLQERDKNV